MIKILFCDVDGTLTNGKMYYTKEGKYMKAFNTLDAEGFNLLKENKIQIVWLTGDSLSGIVKKRAKDLHIKLHANVKDKLEVIKNQYANFSPEEIAFIGSDIPDVELAEFVGLKACPKDAHKSIKKVKGIKRCRLRGGWGCVREFIDRWILE